MRHTPVVDPRRPLFQAEDRAVIEKLASERGLNRLQDRLRVRFALSPLGRLIHRGLAAARNEPADSSPDDPRRSRIGSTAEGGKGGAWA